MQKCITSCMCDDGTLAWYRDGTLYCTEDCQGNVCWYNYDGTYHRSGGLPAVLLIDGTEKWYVNGRLDRVRSPDGTITWYSDK